MELMGCILLSGDLGNKDINGGDSKDSICGYKLDTYGRIEGKFMLDFLIFQAFLSEKFNLPFACNWKIGG